MSTALSLPPDREILSYIETETAACWRKILDDHFRSLIFDFEVGEASSDVENCLWFEYSFTPAELGWIDLSLGRTIAVALGHRLLSVKGRPSEHDHHAIHATAHLLSQLASSLASSFSARLQTAVASTRSAELENPSASAHSFIVPFPGASNDKLLLTVCLSAELIQGLSAAPSQSTLPDAPSSHSPSRNLDLLLDVEMPVSVSFGTTRLQLKDAAKLTTGSIIELNRALSEPIEIIVNNCSIARGEVIVVDGNFGVRIKEIMSKQDRLRSLT
jgi:flagellar motor switch protein FliN